MKKPKDTYQYLEINGDYRMRELDRSDLEQFNSLLPQVRMGDRIR